jgi:hypothetical protein
MTVRELVGATGAFIVLTLMLTYPQIRRLSSDTGWHYDALFSVWRLAWVAHQLPRDPLHLFDANIFYPARHTLAYSDAILLPGALGAPLIWAGLGAVAVHNLLLLFSFVACGVSMYLLVRQLTGSRLAAFFGGVVFAFQPYRFAHYSQLELLWGWPIPLAFLALHRLFAFRRVRDGVLLGVVVAVQAWSSLYYAVFLATALAVLSAVLIIGQPRHDVWRIIRGSIAAAAVASFLIGVYAVPYLDADRVNRLRTEQDVRDWSPILASYLTTPLENRLYGRVMGVRSVERTMFPGFIAVAAALAGLFRSSDRRRLAYAVLLVTAVDLSLGVHGYLYPLAYRTVWLYRELRVPGRMFVVVSAALAVLGGDGVGWVLAKIANPIYRRAAGATLIALVLVESASIPLELSAVAPPPAALCSWLARQAPAVLLEWPVPRASSLGFTHEPLYMYYSTFHWQRLVNGYSGIYPVTYSQMLDHTATFPSPDAIDYLQGIGVQYVILHSEFDPAQYVDLRVALGKSSHFELLLTERQDAGELALYKLRPKR